MCTDFIANFRVALDLLKLAMLTNFLLIKLMSLCLHCFFFKEAEHYGQNCSKVRIQKEQRSMVLTLIHIRIIVVAVVYLNTSMLIICCVAEQPWKHHPLHGRGNPATVPSLNA